MKPPTLKNPKPEIVGGTPHFFEKHVMRKGRILFNFLQREIKRQGMISEGLKSFFGSICSRRPSTALGNLCGVQGALGSKGGSAGIYIVTA